VLREGATGPAVLALQRRLVALGFWLGAADGRFGPSTRHALTAFQKANGLPREGVAGGTTTSALARAVRPRPRSGAGRTVEVDLTRQLLLLVADGQVVWAFDASTGAVAGTTPTGRFKVFRDVDGYDRGPLGVLYRPKYFYRGVAVHGYPSVPVRPASHGCVRVTDDAMDWLWANGALRIGQSVWVYR
jgi:peptidoglycan hydrolase-like protein with peptidoglycan-binding domain